VTAHQQHPLATVIKHHGDRDTAHPKHVLREPRMTGNLNIRQADPDMRRVIHQPLTMDKPLAGVTHKPTLPARPQAPRPVRARPWKTDGYTDRPSRPDPVRYTSVNPRIQRPPPVHDGTPLHRDETAR
jgi:hypothetical protein